MRVPYFKAGTVEDDFLAGAALALKPCVLCRTETIGVEELTVIERGIAARSGRIYPKGACLGHDMILNSVTFREFTPAVALTFVVQIATLDKKDLVELLAIYPRARREIRAAAFRLAFTRAVIMIAKEMAIASEAGYSTTMDQAFVAIRKNKARMALEYRAGEPTRKSLASSISGLAERAESIAREGESSREHLSNQMRSLTSQVRDLGSKFDAILPILQELKSRPTPQRRIRTKGMSNETKEAPPGRLRRVQSSCVSADDIAGPAPASCVMAEAATASPSPPAEQLLEA